MSSWQECIKCLIVLIWLFRRSPNSSEHPCMFAFMPPPRHECLLMCLANVGRMWFFFLGWGEWGGLFPLCGVSGFNKDVPLAKSPLNIFFIIDVQPASSVYGQTKFHQLFPFFIQRRPPPPAPRPLLLYWWSRRLSCSWTTCSTPRRLNTVKAVLSQKHLLRTILFRGNFNFILPFFFFQYSLIGTASLLVFFMFFLLNEPSLWHLHKMPSRQRADFGFN